MVTHLENKPVPIEVICEGRVYKGEGVPLKETCHDGVCYTLDITLNGEHLGILQRAKTGWKMNEVKDQKLIDAIGNAVLVWYE